MRYRGGQYEKGSRWISGFPIEFNADAAPSKVFIVVPYVSFPRFPRSLDGEKNQGIIIVALSVRTIQRSFGVMLQEHDAGTQRCRTRQQS